MMSPSQSLKNNFYFKKILKFCSLNIRSLSEITSKLDKFEDLDKDLKNEIIEFFLKIKVVLPDEEFVDYYLKNLSETKGYTYNQLFSKLSKKVGNYNKLSSKLKTYLSNTEDLQVQRYIDKNFRKLSRMEPSVKRIQYLIQKGFRYEIVKKYLHINNL